MALTDAASFLSLMNKTYRIKYFDMQMPGSYYVQRKGGNLKWRGQICFVSIIISSRYSYVDTLICTCMAEDSSALQSTSNQIYLNLIEMIIATMRRMPR